MPSVTPAHASTLTQWGRALSDETRTRVLLALRDVPARPSNLAARFGVSPQAMSNQLACLRGCGLVHRTHEGRSTWYRLTDPRIGATLGDLLELVTTLDATCCTSHGCTCR